MPRRELVLRTSQSADSSHARYSPKATDYPVSPDAINAYHFIDELFERLGPDDIVVCGDATATIVPYQIGRLFGIIMFQLCKLSQNEYPSG